MPKIVLSSKQEEEIFQQTKNAFSDLPYFDALVAVKLKQAIHDSSNSVINFATTTEGAEKYYDRKAFKVSGANIVQSDLELVWKHIKVIFRYSYVAIVAYTTQTYDEALKEEFGNNYPSFLLQEDMDSNEFNRLFVFWKMIKIAVTIIQPERNKQTLIDVCGRFEDLQMFYITGKGQTQEVTNRVLIYEQEGNVEPEVRPWRSNAEAAADAAAKAIASSRKRKKNRSQDALKTANNVQLDPELVKWLTLSVSPKMQKKETEDSSLYSTSFTGKGQTQEVTNRVLIYEQEGNVEPEVRPWRSNAEAAADAAAKAIASSRKRKKNRSQDALKTANNVQLDPELVKWLTLSVSPKMQKKETEDSSLYSTSFTSLFDTISSHAAPSVSSTTSLTGELDDLVGSIAFQTDLFLENGYFDEDSFRNNSSFHADCFKAYDTDCTESDDSSDKATEDGPDRKTSKR